MSDFEELEQEFGHRAIVTPGCPPVDVLLAWQRESLPPEMQSELSPHIESCEQCRMLLSTLPPPTDAPLTSARRERIWQRTLRGTVREVPPRPSRYWWPAAIAALLIMGAVLVSPLNPWRRQSQTTAQIAPPATIPLVAVAVAKLPPPTDLPAANFLVRGSAPQQPSRDDLAPAFAAYTANDYTRAIVEFDRVEMNFPHSAVPPLYAGVSDLLSNRNGDALLHLKSAALLAPDTHRDETDWYLAIATLRTHPGEALALFHNICAQTHSPHAAPACEAEKALGKRH